MQTEDLDLQVQQQLIVDFKTDRESFKTVYEFYYEMIFRYLLKRTINSEVAYDLTADTFIKAFENFHKFKWVGISIKVWLYRITINGLKNQRRKPTTTILTTEMEGQESLVADVKEELAEIDKTLFGDEELSKLSDAMATLKPEHQNVISLYYFTGLSQKEIAETINTSEGAVKASIHRAMTNLRQLLSPNFI
ncbi:MAG: RNA polymerase sigma factor [Patescibacteria group bacterium]